jgi:hypothetical protein
MVTGAHTDGVLAGTRSRACVLRVTPAALPRATEPGRWLAPVRRRTAPLVEPALFSPLRCPGRLLPQTPSQGVLAALSARLQLRAPGDLLSPEPWLPGLQQAALRIKRCSARVSRPRRLRDRRSPVGRAGRLRSPEWPGQETLPQQSFRKQPARSSPTATRAERDRRRSGAPRRTEEERPSVAPTAGS